MNVNLAAAVVVVMGLAGCASVDRFASRHVEANQVQAEASNQMLLLNIVRASLREPMHFSRIPAVTLPVTSGTLTELLLPFGGDATNNYTLKGQFTAPAASVQIAPQDSQEFIQGVTQPISPALLGFYLGQGWPARLVLSVFVESVLEQDANGGVVDWLDNQPGRPDLHREFMAYVDALAAARPRIVATKSEPEAYGPPFHAGALKSNPEALAAARAAGLQLAKAEGSAYQFQLAPTPGHQLSVDDEKCLTGRDGSKGRQMAGLPGRFERGAKGKKVVLVLRSPAAAIYYLGELLRHADKQPKDPPMSACKNGRLEADTDGASAAAALWPFVAAVTNAGGSPPADQWLTLEYRGKTYSVAVDPSGHDRSSQAMALVAEVLQLQFKGAAQPALIRLQLQ